MSIRKMEHVGIFVDDMNDSVQFYTAILGMQVKNTVTLQTGVDLVFLGFPGMDEILIELVGGNHAGLNEIGRVHHLAFTVDDIDAEIQHLRKHNVTFIDASPKTLPDGTKYIFFFGPNREHLELFQPAPL